MIFRLFWVFHFSRWRVCKTTTVGLGIVLLFFIVRCALGQTFLHLFFIDRLDLIKLLP